jgi:hypothetical protein
MSSVSVVFYNVPHPSGTSHKQKLRGVKSDDVGDTQHYLFVAFDVSVVVWWCAILLKVKWLIPIKLMNGR